MCPRNLLLYAIVEGKLLHLSLLVFCFRAYRMLTDNWHQTVSLVCRQWHIRNNHYSGLQTQ